MAITNATIKKVNTYIAKGIKDETNLDDIKVGLFNEFNLSLGQVNKLVSKYMKDNNLTTRRVGFTSMYYDWLKEGVKTEAEATAFINEHGSANTIRHASHFQAIRVLANDIHNK